MLAKLRRCPVCQLLVPRDEDLAIHLLSMWSVCLPTPEEMRGMVVATHWKECWCGDGMLAECFPNDREWLIRHFARLGGADQHYTDCLMGVKCQDS